MPREIAMEENMNRRGILAGLAIIGSGLMLSQAAAQSAKDLVGAWTLVSADAFGANPKGTVIFEPGGRFSAILMRADLAKYASNNRAQGTPAEYKATVDGSIAYFGTYSMSGTDVNFHIEGSTFPNWTGTDQKRTNVAITGDELKWIQPTPSAGGAAVPVVWRRVK
jgi:Lipocalin-like domain